MIASLFYWTGAVVWGAVGLALLWLAVEGLIGLLNAASVVRWAYRDAKLNNRPLRWIGLPVYFATHAFELTGYRNRGSWKYSYEHGSTWRGIGDWTAVRDTRKDQPASLPAETPTP